MFLGPLIELKTVELRLEMRYEILDRRGKISFTYQGKQYLTNSEDRFEKIRLAEEKNISQDSTTTLEQVQASLHT